MVSETLMTASIVIRSPLLEVFDYVADPENLPEWIPLYSKVAVVSARDEKRANKGDRFKATLSFVPPMFQKLFALERVLPVTLNPEIEVTVDDVVHGRRLAYRAESGWTTVCDFEPSGDRTIFTATQSLWSVPGLISGYLMGPMQAIANDMQRRILEGLRHRLEGRGIELKPRVFFSYRRSNARYVGGRIFDALTAEFGFGTVFRDSNSLLAGCDWNANILEAISECRVVVVHIGDKWEKSLAARRGEADGLRLELEAALKRGNDVRVIPVLTSKRDTLNLHKRMIEIEEGLKPLEQDAPHIHEKFNRRLQVQQLREDPDFSRDLERLMRAVWTAFRSPAEVGQSSNTSVGDSQAPHPT